MIADGLRFKVGLDLSSAERGLRTLGSRLSSTLAVVGVGGGFAGLAASVGAFAKGVVDAGSEAEAFESRLSSLMGSSTAARERLEELYDFAASTPYNTSEIVAAEVTMRGFGAAAEDLMPGLIDFASLTGTDLPQAARDFGKAWQIGATGLESDGGRLLRAQIELQTGLDATTMSIEDFRQSMLDTLSDGMFAGGGERLSRTFTGMVSNLQDEWAGFKREVADAGIFDNVKGVLSVVLDLIKDNRAETTEWANLASDGLWVAFQAIGYTIAGIVDMTHGLQLAVLAVEAGALRVAEGFYSGLAAVVRMEVEFNRMYGTAVALEQSMAALGRVSEQREGLAAMRDSVDSALISSAMGASAMQGWADIIAKAKLRAGGFADEIERAVNPPKPAGGDGDPFGFVKGWEAEIAGQEQLLASAYQFTAEMMALDNTRAENVRRIMYERLAENATLQEQEIISATVAAENETAIKAAAAADLSALEQEAHREKIDNLTTYMGFASDITTALSSLMEGEGEKQKAAHKAFAISSVIIDALAAGIRSFVDLGPIGGAVASAAIGVQAAAAIATISKQHQGGVSEVVYAHQGRFPDEYDRGNTRRLRQEATLNSQATRMLGPQGVAALNGSQGAAAPMVVEFRVGRAVQREVVGEALRPGGSVDRRIVERQRTADRADVGFSGALAV